MQRNEFRSYRSKILLKVLTVCHHHHHRTIILNMGLMHLPEIDYCRTSWVLEVPFFSHVLPRFEMIFSMLHIGHTAPHHPQRKKDKVKALLELLIPKFQQSFDVRKEIAIDETMVGFSMQIFHKPIRTSKANQMGSQSFHHG